MKRASALMSLFLLLVTVNVAQTTVHIPVTTISNENYEINCADLCKPETCDMVVKSFIKPTYLGELKQLERDLNQELKFDKSIYRRILVSFIVDCNDKALSFQIVNGTKTDAVSEKILEALEHLQNWKSAISQGVNRDSIKSILIELSNGKLTAN